MKTVSYRSGLGSARAGAGLGVAGGWLLWSNGKPVTSDRAALQAALPSGPSVADLLTRRCVSLDGFGLAPCTPRAAERVKAKWGAQGREPVSTHLWGDRESERKRCHLQLRIWQEGSAVGPLRGGLRPLQFGTVRC